MSTTPAISLHPYFGADNTCIISGGRFNITSTNWKDYNANYDMYIPFYGFEKFDGYEILNKYVFIRYLIDFDTGNATINVYSSNDTSVYETSLIRTLSAKISVDITISKEDGENRLRNELTAGISFAISAFAISQGVPAVVPAGQAINSLVPHIHKGKDTAGAWNGTKMSLNPYIIKTLPDYYTPTNYAHLYGYPLHATRTLSTMSGFTKVGEIHMEDIPNAMVEEVDEIKRLLEEGVILP